MRQYAFPSQNLWPLALHFRSAIEFCWVCSSLCIPTQKAVTLPSSSVEKQKEGFLQGTVGRGGAEESNKLGSSFNFISPKFKVLVGSALACQSACAAVTEYPHTRGSNSRHLFCHSSRVWMSEIRSGQGWFLWSVIFGLQTPSTVPPHLLSLCVCSCPYHVFYMYRVT